MKELTTIELLKNSFSKLPGVGVKSAERMAYAVLSMDADTRHEFSRAIENSVTAIKPCKKCGMYTENESGLCDICEDENRDKTMLCVVSDIKDAIAIENSNMFKGQYHILGGLLSASKGLNADGLNIDALISRVKDENIQEVILATSPTVDGEMTGLFIAKLLENSGATISRLAYGLPMGSSVTYADSLTLSKAFEGRKKL